MFRKIVFSITIVILPTSKTYLPFNYCNFSVSRRTETKPLSLAYAENEIQDVRKKNNRNLYER